MKINDDFYFWQSQVSCLVQEVAEIDDLGLEVGYEKEINAALLHTWEPGEEAALRRLDEFVSGDLYRFTRSNEQTFFFPPFPFGGVETEKKLEKV